MAQTLQLAPGLTFPLDAVTRAGVITGQRGTGKTSTAVVEVEEADAAGAPSVIIDPTDAWWGLRSSADGKRPGLSHVVFGGDHGHLPLREDAGGVMGRLIAEQRLAAVFSLMQMRKGAQLRFVTEFLEELYHLNREALLVVIDEAHRFAPAQLREQEKGGYGARCLGATVDIASLGRKNGLGIRLVTQRLARLHADAREACEIVIVHRLIGTNDRKAVEGWLRDASLDDEAAQLGRKLPTLKRGEALVYAPDLEILGEFKIREKRTFDSSGTPEVGASRVEPKGVADVDLDAIEAQIGETLERAKAEDPKALRRRIVELERDLRARPTEKQVETVTETVEVPVLGDDALERLSETVEELAGVAGKLVAATNEITGALGKLKARPPARVERPSPTPAAQRDAEPRAPAAPRTEAVGDLKLGKAHRAILAVLDQRRGLATSKRQLAVATGYAIGGGGFNNPLGALRTVGLIEGSDPIVITEEGAEAIAGNYEPLPTGHALLEHWCRLGKAHALILRELAQHYPNSVSKQDLADATGYEVSGGGFNNPLGKLRTLELIEGRGELRLTDAFGDEVVGVAA